MSDLEEGSCYKSQDCCEASKTMTTIKISPGRVEIQTNDRYIDGNDPDNIITRGIHGRITESEKEAVRKRLKKKLKGGNGSGG